MLHALDALASGNYEDSSTALSPCTDPLAERLRAVVDELRERDSRRAAYLSFVKHEIANPLAIAQANLEAMIDGVSELGVDRLERVLDATQAAAALLLDLSRSPTRVEEAFDIHLGVFNVCSLIQHEARALEGMANAKGVAFAYSKCGEAKAMCLNFRGDERRIAQILRNLLINAVRYTPPGGSVEIVCEAPDADLVVSIRDTGIGISDEALSRIFEPGFQAAPGGVGSGLGLGVVKDLSERVGASVRVARQERGTMFTVRLPVVPL